MIRKPKLDHLMKTGKAKERPKGEEAEVVRESDHTWEPIS